TPFLLDLAEIRRRARSRLGEGPVTSGYKADRRAIIQLLNDALATEIVCVLRYRRHHFSAKGIHAEPVSDELMEHSIKEQEHADDLRTILEQLEPSSRNPDLI